MHGKESKVSSPVIVNILPTHIERHILIDYEKKAFAHVFEENLCRFKFKRSLLKNIKSVQNDGNNWKLSSLFASICCRIAKFGHVDWKLTVMNEYLLTKRVDRRHHSVITNIVIFHAILVGRDNLLVTWFLQSFSRQWHHRIWLHDASFLFSSLIIKLWTLKWMILFIKSRWKLPKKRLKQLNWGNKLQIAKV